MVCESVTKKSYLYIGLTLIPSFVFLWAGQFRSIWWIENLTGIPLILIGYYALLSVIFLFFAQYRFIVCNIGLAFIWFLSIPVATYERGESCIKPVSILQYNLRYENPDLSAFIEYIRTQPVDLVVLQEVSPGHGEQFRVLDNVYPFQYGGLANIGYPSGQMVLSKNRLYGMSVHSSVYGHKLIRGIWQPIAELDIALYVGHPPSPRTESLWLARNATMDALEDLVSSSPLDTTLVVGDFNLSSESHRFKRMLVEFERQPVGSWPVELAGVQFPKFSMIGIDHLWLKSDSKAKYGICHRRALPEFRGSDHSPILTVIGKAITDIDSDAITSPRL